MGIVLGMNLDDQVKYRIYAAIDESHSLSFLCFGSHVYGHVIDEFCAAWIGAWIGSFRWRSTTP